MKLFAPLALSAGIHAEENCGQITYINNKQIHDIWHLGSYATGYQNYATDWKALFFKNLLRNVYQIRCNGIAAINSNVECAGVTVYDIKNDFQDCDHGKWCTEMNLRVTTEFAITSVHDLECEGSADLPDDDDISRMMRNLGSFDGVDLGFDIDLDISIDDLNNAIDDSIDSGTTPDEFNPDEIGEPEQGTSTEEDDESTSIVDGNGDSVDISGDCSGGECVCDDGYTGPFCTDDVNECDIGDNNCVPGQNCHNTDGGYYCVDAANPECPSGYSGTAPDNCVDDDECQASPCGDNATCGNLPGSFSCTCNAGFSFEDGACVDTNECNNSPCTNAVCTNSVGTYSCDCFENFVAVPALNTPDTCHLQANYECFDGSNGGCSHFCSTEGCGCPDCWTLLADGKTCVPASQHLHVMCGAAKMQMSVDECVYGAGEAVTLALADNTCGAALDENGMWTSETSLDGCQTTVTAENDIIQFVNTITVASRSSHIVMHSDPEISFTCQYSSNVDGVSSSISVQGETHVAEGSTSDGSFEFLLNFVAPDKDGVFSAAQNDTMIVGERVFFEIENSNPISGVSFVVQDCAVSDAHGNSHKIVDSNCLDSNTLVQREAPFEMMISEANARFSYTAFIFANSPDTTSANLELVCNIAACLDADCANIINDCGARRRRRAAAPQAQTYKLTTSGRFSDL